MVNEKYLCNNPYSILAINSNSSKEDIKNRYKKFLKYHPDYAPKTNYKELNEICKKKYNRVFSKINNAFTLFKNNNDIFINDYEITIYNNLYKEKLEEESISVLQWICERNELTILENKELLINKIVKEILI